VIKLEIDSMTLGPWGIGRNNGRVVMTRMAAPSDLLEVVPIAELHDYTLARISRIVRASPARRQPPCAYAVKCGGCDWQHLTYAAQVENKAKLLAQTFSRVLKADIPTAGLMVPAPSELGYRSRVRFQADQRGRIGFFEPSGRQMVEVDNCLVAAEAIEIPRAFAGALAGRLRDLEVVENGSGGKVFVVNLRADPSPSDLAAAESAIKNDASARGAILRGPRVRRTLGESAIAIEIEPTVTIRAEADLFTQVNREVNRQMVAHVIELV
jgi:tRNA/tmRNA/rRNA uracil-C5-methylase (TrmA/RlmC/RlmD family)